MKTAITKHNRARYLKIEWPDYSGAKKALIQHRSILCKIRRNSPRYKDEMKTHFQLLIFVKAHALALDTKTERRRLLNLFMKEMEYLRIL